MAFGSSETYIYAYIAFAAVYLIASFVFVAISLRVSAGLSRSRQVAGSHESLSAEEVLAVLEHGRRLVDYTQLSTLLPLIYIVGSMFLGSVVLGNAGVVRTVNVAWIAFTVLCALAGVVLALLGVRESSAIGPTSQIPEQLPGSAPAALQRVGLRLGVSAALLLLVAVFTMLNLWSIITSLDVLSRVDFLL